MKNLINKFNDFLIKYLSLIIIIFLLIQPVLDLITSLEINIIHTNFSIGSIVRFIFLLLCTYYILIINKEKKYKIITSIIYVYILIFCLTILYVKDFSVLLFEARNAVNTFYLPVVLTSFYLMNKNNHLKINMNYLIITYLIYILFILVPNLTNTGFLSYYHSKVGSTGWFYSANAIGNILCFTLPFMFYYLVKYKINIFIKLTIFASLCYVFASMGTKVPILGLGICIMIHFVYFFINWCKEKKYHLIFSSIGAAVIGIVLIVVMLPKTSFYKNIQIHKEFLGFDHYYEVVTKPKLIDHFIFSQRLTFLKNSHNNFIKTKPIEKLVGMGYIENYATDEVSDKTIEMDYFEVFYRHGVIGFIIFYSIMIPFFVICFKQKRNPSLLKLEFKTSLILILLLALFSGHIFITPSVSIFVAVVMIFYMSNKNYNNIKINE